MPKPNDPPTAKTNIPAISTGVAIQSLRHSGYDLPTALGEVIDNSIEANANEIHIRLDEKPDKRGKKHVHRIVIADDGVGMSKDTLHHYLQFGFSTRYMKLNTIGKFGVGAKLAAINFACRIDAWSRQSPKEPWRHVYLELPKPTRGEDPNAGDTFKGEVTIEQPQEGTPPKDISDVFPNDKGTVVIWSQIDRLEDGRYAKDANSLRVEVEKELSRIFRYFIHAGRVILVNNIPLRPHDPLFRMDRTWADLVLTEQQKSNKPEPQKGNKQSLERHFESWVLVDREEIAFAGGKALLTVTTYPREVVRTRGKGGDELAKRLRVPDNLGAISFVRLNREISYTLVPKILPHGVQDPDRFIGIEVSFTPELDEYFGVRNVKRGVEPHGELRDEIRKRLERYIKVARNRIEEMWGEAAKSDGMHTGEVAPVQDAVSQVNHLLPQPRAPQAAAEEVNQALEDLAQDIGLISPAQREATKERWQKLPVIIESVAFPGNSFLDIQHLGSNTILRVNTRHRFYKELWEPLLTISRHQGADVSGEEAVRTSRRAIEALTLLVTAYAKAESMHSTPDDQYGELRDYWGQFLGTLLGKIRDVM